MPLLGGSRRNADVGHDNAPCRQGAAEERHRARWQAPPPNTQRWVARRKAEVVAAVRAGLLSLEDACRRYHLSTEEFMAWQAAIDKHGLGGLRVTRIQDFR